MDLVEFFHWKIFIVLLKLVSGTDIKEDHIACIEQPFLLHFFLFMLSQNNKAQWTICVMLARLMYCVKHFETQRTELKIECIPGYF